jgi:hypothetical protein
MQKPRNNQRDRVIKSALVLVGNTTFTCILRDISTSGARISFSTPMMLPKEFSLRLSDGSTYPAIRRWTRGLDVGLEFTAASSATGNEGQARRAAEALESLTASTEAKWLAIVRAERYFGDEALHQAVEAVEIAHEQLKAKLRLHIPKTPAN